MVNLMLKDAPEESVSPDLHPFEIEVAISDNNSAGAIYLRFHAGDGQASFFVNTILIRLQDDLRIEKDLKSATRVGIFIRLDMVYIYNNSADEFPHLRRRKTHTLIGIIHCPRELINKAAQGGRGALNGLRDLLQKRIPIYENRTGHFLSRYPFLSKSLNKYSMEKRDFKSTRISLKAHRVKHLKVLLG